MDTKESKQTRASEIDYKYEKIKKSPKEILDSWHYLDSKDIENRIKDYGLHEGSLNDIVNEIVLWKVNRQVSFGNDKELLNDIWNLENVKIAEMDSFSDEWAQKTEEIVRRMLVCRGIKMPMASTILHFFHPSTYLIMDQRAYRVIFKEEMPNNPSPQMYTMYLKKCVKYYKDQKLNPDIAFELLDRYLYQMDKEMKNKVSY